MLIINPYIFKQFPEITFGFSTKWGLGKKPPYYFNMSYTVRDNKQSVTENRTSFFNEIGLESEAVAFQKQIHGDGITVVIKGGNCGESDAMVTGKKDIGIAISTADCCAIFIYDPVMEVITGVHSGWRGTAKKILSKVLNFLSDNYDSKPEDLICYLGPSIQQQNYEVGSDVAEQFESTYIKKSAGEYFLDIPQINYDILLNYGVSKHNIQVSQLCSYGYSELLHSYRRDGEKSGRALGVIAMKGKQ